ncbi:MAG: sigma 54-interacting transcriptional regulator [Planctomycetota bacterium]
MTSEAPILLRSAGATDFARLRSPLATAHSDVGPGAVRVPRFAPTRLGRPMAERQIDSDLDESLGLRFTVRERFEGGEGWSGVVAPRRGDGGPWFLKVLEEGIDLAEASLLASLQHPQIPRVLETGVTAGGRPYFLRELIPGQPLQTCFPMSPREVTDCAVQMLEVLAYVHLRGILHLDLKPGNIVRSSTDAGPRYHLLDFGLGRRGGGRAAGGTPFFAAPETLLGLPASPRSDLFSLGAVLFAALPRGERPLPLSRFLASFPRDDFFAALGETADDLPDELRHILPRLLARRPEARYADAQEALEAFTGGSGRPSPATLALDPISTFGAALERAAESADAAADLMIEGGSAADRQALALHAACAIAGVREVAVAAGTCRLVRGGGAPFRWSMPSLSLSDIAQHLENVLGLDSPSAHRAADVLLDSGADTPDALRACLQALVDRGVIVPHGVRWIWPDAIAGRVRLDVPEAPANTAEDLTALAERGAVERARAAFQSLLRRLPDQERALREALASGYLRGGEPSRALPLVHDLPFLRVHALLDLGRVHAAQAEFAHVGESVRAAPYGIRLAAALANARGEFEQAERLLRLPAAADELDSNIALGLVLYNRGDLEHAGAVLRAALLRLGDERPFTRAAALTNLAEVRRREGDLVAARDHHADALRLLQDLGHVRYTAIASSNLGVLAKDLGQLDEAMQHHRRARAMFAHIGDERGAALAEANLGVASLEAGDVDLSARRLALAVASLQRLGAEESLPLVRAFLARALAAAGEVGAARAELARIGQPTTERIRSEVKRVMSLLQSDPMPVPPSPSPSAPGGSPSGGGDGWISRGVFRTFLAVNRRLASEAKLERAMEYLLEAAVTLSGARTGLLLVVRKDGVRLEVRAGDAPPQGLAFSRSLVHRAIQTRRPLTADEARADRGLMEMPSVRGLAVKSVLCVPFVSASGTEGALYVEHAGRPGVFAEAEKEHLEVLADQAAIAVDRMVREEQLANELERSRRSLEVVNRTMRRPRSTKLIGESPPMRTLDDQVRKLGPTDLAVLVLGETGTGKELVARAIHDHSLVAKGPFVSVNCAAIPADLMESELFGHVKGAFTGADDDRQGLMELASGGTLFLDEIGDMPLPMQAKLLRALQEGHVRPVGSGETRTVHVRVVAATHRDVQALVAANEFRQDLYYRIAGAELRVPPLRERGDDVLLIAADMLKRLGQQHRRDLRLNDRGRDRLRRYGWPGNVRELEHVLARVAILSDGSELDDLQLPEASAPAAPGEPPAVSGGWPVLSMQEAEERTIRAALRSTGGDKTAAARVLGISRTALYDKLKRMAGG